MGSANSHNFDDLPPLVFDSRIQTPGHWRKQDAPMSNLYLGLLQLLLPSKNISGKYKRL